MPGRGWSASWVTRNAITLVGSSATPERQSVMSEISQLIFDFDAGYLNVDEAIALFQQLVDTGLAWTLRGTYGHTAQTLIDNGVIHA